MYSSDRKYGHSCSTEFAFNALRDSVLNTLWGFRLLNYSYYLITFGIKASIINNIWVTFFQLSNVRKFPFLGIYVVMFTDVFKTFLKFSVICALFIIAFSLGFYALMAEQARQLCYAYFSRTAVQNRHSQYAAFHESVVILTVRNWEKGFWKNSMKSY